MTRTNEFRALVLLAAVALSAALLMLAAASKPAQAAFPGTNGKVAFRHQTGNSSGDIYTINPNGSSAEPLTANNAAEHDPAWSANGRKVVFEREHDLFKMRANGSHVTRLTNTPSSEAHESEPTWSPDGTTIAFGRGFEIYVMNADGSGTPQRLTTNGDGSYMPAWSPDGTKIAFSRFSTNCGGSFCFQLDIYVMNATSPESATNQPQQLTDDPASDWGPSWAPLGDTIAFTSSRDGNDNIYAMNADGSDEIRLTSNTASDQEPAYSPTGRKIAFSSNRKGNEEIYIMDSDGTDKRRITFLAQDDDEPDWQPLTQ